LTYLSIFQRDRSWSYLLSFGAPKREVRKISKIFFLLIEFSPINIQISQTCKLYILTLAVLPTYRRRNIGTQLLRSVITAAEVWNENPRKHNPITSVYLHVQISNTIAMMFYEGHGFENTDIVEGYYKRIEPADAFKYEFDLATSKFENNEVDEQTEENTGKEGEELKDGTK